MINYEALKFSRNMKYTALYSTMYFVEEDEDVYIRKFDDCTIRIQANTQELFINGNFAFLLNSHKSFVKLECIVRILNLGYKISDIVGIGNKNYFFFKGFLIIFFAWDEEFNFDLLNNHNVLYKSRLVSGVIEYKTKIMYGDIYDYGLFEEKVDQFNFSKAIVSKYDDPDFIIEENRVVKYIGKSNVVKVPYGIQELESSSFWDNQFIEKVILPETLENFGGDTFYNCKNLKEINIPKSVKLMGDNPFAGCPKIKVSNESPYFFYENGVLYTYDKKTLIYCSVIGKEDKFIIPDEVSILGKHSFYLCDRFHEITIPSSVIKIKNNPFSGCNHLKLINNSPFYNIVDSVIYNKFKTAVVGCLNNIKTDELKLLDTTKTINRNSFWNCKGINKIIFPENLIDIGYNPFVGCDNIHFVSKSNKFKVVDDILYNEDMSKLICCPKWKAVGELDIPENVITLERGAFSGCELMTGIKLHNVNLINKSCFTNCTSLQNVYCSDLVYYIGVWSFAYCNNLKEISVFKGTKIDDNAFSNCDPKVIVRDDLTNYVIESDNIFSLKSLKARYEKKIDSILIDPPYNSKINYIGYKDSDYDEGYENFIYARLKLAKDLLSNKGFLVINIDEGELSTIVKVCSDIFGNDLVSTYRWKKKHEFFDSNRVVLNPNKKQTDFEYIVICKNSENCKFNLIKQPYLDGDKLLEKWSNIPEVFDCFGTTSSAKDEIEKIFGDRTYFSTPKPVKLMIELVRATTDKNSIVLDFFAGSGTVGEAVEKLNSDDGGKRKFILVSNSESNICKNVTVKRLEKVKANFVFLD